MNEYFSTINIYYLIYLQIKWFIGDSEYRIYIYMGFNNYI